jgi:GT2 family glycosyltransferase
MSVNHGVSVELILFDLNTRGLPVLYNSIIRQAADDPAILVFAHDDLHLLDYFWPTRVMEGLSSFEIIGLAGNKRRLPCQPAWAFKDASFTWDDSTNLSGVVGHGQGHPPENLSAFGAPRQRVLLMDGLFLATHSETLLEHQILFDERFDFHFYDLDFCRQAELRGVTCGTWDIAVVHESRGNFGSPAWYEAYQKYLQKWGD